MTFMTAPAQWGQRGQASNAASRAEDRQPAPYVGKATMLPSARRTPCLRARLSGEPAIGSVMWWLRRQGKRVLARGEEGELGLEDRIGGEQDDGEQEHNTDDQHNRVGVSQDQDGEDDTRGNREHLQAIDDLIHL